MVTPRRSVTEGRWPRSFAVAFLAIATAVLFIALPACSPKTTIIDVKDEKNNPKKMVITYDRNMENVAAIVDGKALKVSDRIPFPIVLGPHAKKIGGIYPGPMIVFEGSSCICYPSGGGLRCIAYPPGTPCP